MGWRNLSFHSRLWSTQTPTHELREMISVGVASSGAASNGQINVALQRRRGACQKDPHEDIVLLPFSYHSLPKQIHPILEKQCCVSLLPDCLLFISLNQEGNKFHTHCERKNTFDWDHWNGFRASNEFFRSYLKCKDVS